MSNPVYVLAWNKKEAEFIASEGVGVETMEEARKWLKELKTDPVVDPYYGNKYKIFKVANPTDKQEDADEKG